MEPYMRQWKDYYEILEVNPEASQEDIKKAHRKLALGFHPDKNRNITEQMRKLADEKMAEINEAYEVLYNPEKRKQYDSEWTAKKSPPKPVIDPPVIRFDNVPAKTVKTSSFIIRNEGGPYSKIEVDDPKSWVRVIKYASLSDTDELPLQVEIMAEGEDWGTTYSEVIIVRLDNEETQVKIELRTQIEPMGKTTYVGGVSSIYQPPTPAHTAPKEVSLKAVFWICGVVLLGFFIVSSISTKRAEWRNEAQEHERAVALADTAEASFRQNNYPLADEQFAQASRIGANEAYVRERKAKLYTKYEILAPIVQWSQSISLSQYKDFRIYSTGPVTINDGHKTTDFRSAIATQFQTTKYEIMQNTAYLSFRALGSQYAKVSLYVTDGSITIRNPMSNVLSNGYVIITDSSQDGFARGERQQTDATQNTQDVKVPVSKQPPVPSNAIEFYVTSEEREVPHASKGKHWWIELKDSSDILEFRGINDLSDGTHVSVGKPWRLGGTAEAGKSFNFPTADRYFVKIINKKESKFFWFER